MYIYLYRLPIRSHAVLMTGLNNRASTPSVRLLQPEEITYLPRLALGTPHFTPANSTTPTLSLLPLERAIEPGACDKAKNDRDRGWSVCPTAICPGCAN